MVKTIAALREDIESTEQILSVVKTMKALAAINIREYERAVESLSYYNETIELGLQIALRNRKPVPMEDRLKGQKLAVIVFGSEQGLAGQFNERIATYTVSRLSEMDDDWENRRIMAVGRRVIGHLLDGGLHVTDETLPPNSLGAIRSASQNILLKIDEWRKKRGVERIVLFHNVPISNASFEPRMRWMLPVNTRWLRSLQDRDWDSRSLPMYRLPYQDLFSGLIRQYLFVLLYRAIAESMASENASRLRSMQSAEGNIEDRLSQLKSHYQQRRQTSITEELLDIMSGFEALSD